MIGACSQISYCITFTKPNLITFEVCKKLKQINTALLPVSKFPFEMYCIQLTLRLFNIIKVEAQHCIVFNKTVPLI